MDIGKPTILPEDRRAAEQLNQLIRLNEDSKEGFRIAAESVKNRGLKALLKAYARQRAEFARELQAEVKQLNGQPRQRGTVLGGLHRGWIVIKAALTIGPENTENVVLAEAERGEKYALARYEAALKQSLPPAIRATVERQAQAVKAVAGQIAEMKGNSDGRLVVRLFEGDADVRRAAQALHDAGYPRESISTLVFNHAISVYENDREGNTLVETTGAGGLSGALAGALLGFAAGLATLLIPDVGMAFATTMAGTLAIVTFVGLAIGALFGALFGALIGLGTVEQDTYLYQNSLRPGQILMLVRTDSKRATEAALIMQRVNLARA